MTGAKLDRLQRLDLLGFAPAAPAGVGVPVRLDLPEPHAAWPRELRARWAAAFAWDATPGPRDLIRALAAHHGVDEGEVAIAPGFDPLLQATLLAWGLGRPVVTATPTSASYARIARAIGLTTINVLRDADFALPVRQLAAAAAHHDAGVVVVGNPNDPTGNLATRDELLELAQGAPGLLAVDERGLAAGGPSMVGVPAENVVVLKSIPGASPFGLAYMVGAPRAVADVVKVLPGPPTAAALLAGQLLLGEAPTPISLARDQLRHDLMGVAGVVSWPSAAPWLLVGSTMPGEELAARLLDRGVAVQALSRPPIATCIRITVGTPTDHEALVAALKGICGEAPPPPGGF